VVKGDDDILVNLPALAAALRAHQHAERAYIGCMRTGSPLRFAGDAAAYADVGQALPFSDPSPAVLPYAAGHLYALSRQLALHLVEASPLLRRAGNEDVSVGSWLVGLDVTAVDEPRFCCPHCGRQGATSPCVAVVQPACGGVCLPQLTLPRLAQLCDPQATPATWALSESLLAKAEREAKEAQ